MEVLEVIELTKKPAHLGDKKSPKRPVSRPSVWPHISREALSMLGEAYLADNVGFYYSLEPMSRGWIGAILRGFCLSISQGKGEFAGIDGLRRVAVRQSALLSVRVSFGGLSSSPAKPRSSFS